MLRITPAIAAGAAEVSDIITRLRTWVHAVDAVPASDLMDEAADVIESLRHEVAVLMTERQVEFQHERPRPDAAW